MKSAKLEATKRAKALGTVPRASRIGWRAALSEGLERKVDPIAYASELVRLDVALPAGASRSRSSKLEMRHVRATAQELGRWDAAAERRGVSFSEWARGLLNEAA